MSPALAAGLAERPRTMDDLVHLIKAREPDAIEVTTRRRDRRR